jgi:osmotically-inducible protein OsmY
MKALQGWSAVLALAVVALVSYGCENTGRAREEARETGREAKTRTVILRGTVPSAAQKEAAERIAREKAQGYSVRNELTISAS